MDFVEWCDFVLCKVIEASRKAPTHRSIGVQESDIARILFGQEVVEQLEFQQSPQRVAMMSALSQLQLMGFVERKPFWKVTRTGQIVSVDPLPVWFEICQEKLDEEHQQLLKVVNQRGVHTVDGLVSLTSVTSEVLLSELNWADGFDLLWPIAQDLQEWEYITGSSYLDRRIELSPTYRGLVWETRRSYTIESRFIDDLVAEWETTSVEFKQYLYVNSVEQKAEFIKDILSLANTQASGRRWLIVGFSNKTHGYANAPNSLIQDDLERMLAEYTDPPVEIRYEVAAYSKGPVGKLEVLRDPKKLPYRVAKSLGDKLKGDKKQIFKGQIFVRHGSQVEEPTPAEEHLLIEEGERARSQ